MAIKITASVFIGIGYCVRKMIINRKSLEDKEKSRGISETKELVRRNLNFVLYVTHLSTFSKTASGMPLACHKLCQDECNEYLKTDYIIQRQAVKRNEAEDKLLIYVTSYHIVRQTRVLDYCASPRRITTTFSYDKKNFVWVLVS